MQNTYLENRLKAYVDEKTAGGGLPEVTDADEGKVLTVDSSGEWAAEMPSGVPVIAVYQIDSSGTHVVLGDYEICKKTLTEEKPILAYYWVHTCGTSEFYDPIVFWGVYYSAEDGDIVLAQTSVEGFLWHSDGTVTSYNND